jgi:serine/threonine protein kinase
MTIAERTQFGPYRLLEKIGAGGMGEVYRALDTRLEREVALKLVSESYLVTDLASGSPLPAGTPRPHDTPAHAPFGCSPLPGTLSTRSAFGDGGRQRKCQEGMRSVLCDLERRGCRPAHASSGQEGIRRALEQAKFSPAPSPLHHGPGMLSHSRVSADRLLAPT